MNMADESKKFAILTPQIRKGFQEAPMNCINLNPMEDNAMKNMMKILFGRERREKAVRPDTGKARCSSSPPSMQQRQYRAALAPTRYLRLHRGSSDRGKSI